MRKLITFNFITADGYVAGSERELNWHHFDDEHNQFIVDQNDELDTMLFGRITYELMEEYWPIAREDPDTNELNNMVADFINENKKIVFSKTLKDVTWNNTQLESSLSKEFIEGLKNEQGKNIAIYGSGNIVRQLSELNLIDEYRFMVDPIILGEGMKLFDEKNKMELNLSNFRKFDSGRILLCYIQKNKH